MEYIEKIKKMLCKELDEYAMKGKLTMADLDAVHKLTDTVKNLDKIAMLDDGGYSEARGRSYMHGSSYDDDMMYSERRGRGRNAKRDSMGRYSSDDYSEDYRGSSYDSYRGYDRRYSKDGVKDHMMTRLGEMMEDASQEQREALKKCMREIEKA